MKTPVVITTIISGTALLLAPFIYRAVVTLGAAIAFSEVNHSFTFRGGIQYWYDIACMVVGILMIAIGLADSLGFLSWLREEGQQRTPADRRGGLWQPVVGDTKP